MDLSDGLSKDCRTLSYENKLGIILKYDALRIPERNDTIERGSGHSSAGLVS